VKIVNANAGILPFIKDDLILGDDETNTIESLRRYLVEFPNNIRIFAGIDRDESEKQKITGFIIAISYEGQPHVFIIQLWTLPEMGNLDEKLFSRICLWAESLGKRELRIESGPASNRLEKEWNFWEYNKIMAFTLSEDFEIEMLKNRKETEDVTTGSGDRSSGSTGRGTTLGRGRGHKRVLDSPVSTETSVSVDLEGTPSGTDSGPVDEVLPGSDPGGSNPGDVAVSGVPGNLRSSSREGAPSGGTG